jgi:predicted nucleotidyltransferase
MMATVTIPPEKMARYRATARQRAAAEQAALDRRYARAWQTAQAAAALLKTQFDAKQVVIFGSLVNRQRFHTQSDIDLAAWGVAERAYLRALSALLDLDLEFSFDLVRMEEAEAEANHAALVKTIAQQGQTL